MYECVCDALRNSTFRQIAASKLIKKSTYGVEALKLVMPRGHEASTYMYVHMYVARGRGRGGAGAGRCLQADSKNALLFLNMAGQFAHTHSLATLRVSHKQAGCSNGLKTRARWNGARREQLRAGWAR